MHHGPNDHPDLAEVGRRLQRRLDQVLEAEQEAAALAVRRGATLRDRLADAEDEGLEVTVACLDGSVHRGTVAVVALDHVELAHGPDATLVPLEMVVSVGLR